MKKFRKDNGITLIALVVTIVVLLILAGITISTLFGENGIINAAKRAEQDTADAENTTNEGLQNLEDKMNDQLGKGKLTASKVANDPKKYYSKKVNYIAGSETFQTGLGVDWKILYADDSHIYLIASDYVPRVALPYSTDVSGNVTANKPLDGNNSYGVKTAKFGSSETDGIMPDYADSTRVADSVKYLNKSYFDYLETNSTTSTNANIKAVAYMLDTKAWEAYKDANGKADFVIGGPTIEMLMNSYNQKYGDIKDSKAKYQAKAISTKGYEISNNYGADDSWHAGISSFFATSDPLYVITSRINAYCYWVASPSSPFPERVLSGYSTSDVAGNDYSSPALGFRPVVSLKSNIVLEEQEDGSFNIK